MALGLLMCAGQTRAEDPPQAPAQAAKELESRKVDLESAESRGRELQKSVAVIAKEREEINKRLLETAALIQRSEAQLTAREARLAELGAQEKVLRDQLHDRYDQIAQLLAALQRMGRNPPPVMITRREDALKMVRSAMLLATAFPEMRTQAMSLADKLDQLVKVMADARTESERLKAETTRLNDMRTRLAGLLETKKQSLAERQAELLAARKAATELSKSVNDLSDLITKLDQEVSKPSALAAYEAESHGQIAAAAPPGPAAPPLGAGSITSAVPAPQEPAPHPASQGTEVAALLPPGGLSPPTHSVVELAPDSTSLVPGNPGRIKPAIAFALAKSRLPMPAQGRRVLAYGDKTQYGGTSKGIVIETRANAQVTSPCDGWIVYSGEFRSYGQLLIINAGGGYHVLVAGLSQIDVQPGQFVLAAEPVGTMGGGARTNPGVIEGAAQVAAQQVSTQSGAPPSSPVLYVEFRKDGQPIDPDPWWVAGQQKVLE